MGASLFGVHMLCPNGPVVGFGQAPAVRELHPGSPKGSKRDALRWLKSTVCPSGENPVRQRSYDGGELLAFLRLFRAFCGYSSSAQNRG